MTSWLRNSRSVVLRHCKPAQPPPVTTGRHHEHIHAAPWRPPTSKIFLRRITSYHQPSVFASLHASDPSVRRWFNRLWKVAAAVALPYAAYREVTHEEIVPYTNRTHRVISLSDDKDIALNSIKMRYGDRFLDPSDPNTVRVRRIANDIISGLHRSHLAKNPCDNGTANSGGSSLKDQDPVQNRQGTVATLGRLRGLNWEVFVVRDDRQNAYSWSSGKIVVCTGFLQQLDTDDEIATLLAHEIGHVVAGHFLEFHRFVLSSLSRMLPFCRRNEIEADHIGIMLVAAAGFDPRVAPGFYQKRGEINGDSAWEDYFGSHPSCKTMSRLLSQHKVMDKALELYHTQLGAREGSS